MISYREACEILLSRVPLLGRERCKLEEATGRVLRENVCADRALPPYDRVMMDGYALRSEGLTMGRIFRVVGIAAAGRPQTSLPAKLSACIEVMTGALLPAGADCIVPVEYTHRREDGVVMISDEFFHVPDRFIHASGSDAAAGEVLLREGTLLSAREIGVAASCGADEFMVSARPRIAVQPTGDELVDVTAEPEAYQIRQSNGHALRAALRGAGYSAEVLPTLGDDSGVDSLVHALEQCDWLIITGAVSKGSRDFIPGLLGRLGCEKLFHGVSQKPGKPAGAWLGKNGQVILALPGNPVSALVGLHALALPALGKAMGLMPRSPQKIELVEPFPALANMTMHLPVKIESIGRARAMPVGNSGDYVGLLRSDGFITMEALGANQKEYVYQSWL